MHTVRWVSEQLGLRPGTLRAWEQRYGVVHPARSGGGYRLYDDDDLDVLRTMADLVGAGMQPAQAALQARAESASARGGVRGAGVGPGEEPVGAARLVGAAPAGLPDPESLLASARGYQVRALEEVLDAAFGAASFEYVVDTWLMAAMVGVGRAWAGGHLDVAQEHFISAGVMRRLSAAFNAAGHARAGRHVVTGLAPGATHEIATLAFATMLRRVGLRVTYLGPDLPVHSWVRAVESMRPDAAVVGAPRAADAGAAAEVVRALGESTPAIAVFVGGPGAPPERVPTGDTLAHAADWLADALAAPARGAARKR